MKCNLVKEKKSYEVKGKTKVVYNYFVITENGIRIPISCRYYDTEKADSSKKEMLERLNFSNAQMLYAFADLVVDDEKEN